MLLCIQLTTDNKISITALALATLSYIPSFIALFRTIPKTKIAISDFNCVDGDSCKEFVFKLCILNKSSMPIKINKISLLINKRTFESDSRFEIKQFINSFGINELNVAFHVPKDTSEQNFKFIIFTTTKRIKTKRLRTQTCN